MSATQIITVKSGAEFRFSSQFSDLDTSVPADLTGYTLASHVDQPDGTLVEALTATWLDASTGSFEVSSADTSAWPMSRLLWDIRLTTPMGAHIFSDTFVILVEQGITS